MRPSAAPSRARPAAVVLAVAAGGAVGAVLRMAVVTPLDDHVPAVVGPTIHALATEPAFPWGTLLVNVVGALLLGWAVDRIRGEVSTAFLQTGVLGAFTTFGAFAVQGVRLAERSPATAAAYVLVSLGAGLVAVRLPGWIAGRGRR